MQDVTLTLDPGTVIKGSSAYRGGMTFNVRGVLRSQGTADRPVIITSLNDDSVGADASSTDPYTNGDQWRGIGLQPFEDRLPSLVLRHTVLRDPTEAIVVHDGVLAELSHVTWETTTSSQGALINHSDLLTIDDSTFSSVYGMRALWLSGGGAVRRTSFVGTTVEVMAADAILQDVVFSEQISLPLTVSAAAAGSALDARYADGSSVPLTLASYTNVVDSDITWPGGRTYFLTYGLRILPGATLTLRPGAVVKTTRNQAIDVAGTLVSAGTTGTPVIFSPTLSTAGADVNRFSDSWSSDSWRGLSVASGGSLLVDHVARERRPAVRRRLRGEHRPPAPPRPRGHRLADVGRLPCGRPRHRGLHLQQRDLVGQPARHRRVRHHTHPGHHLRRHVRHGGGPLP